MHKVKILIASRDGSITRSFLKDLQTQSEVSGNVKICIVGGWGGRG